jgi:hypothetical protein
LLSLKSEPLEFVYTCSEKETGNHLDQQEEGTARKTQICCFLTRNRAIAGVLDPLVAPESIKYKILAEIPGVARDSR